MSVEQKNPGTLYLENVISAIPTKHFCFQIALLRWMTRVTEAAHAMEVADRPENPPQLPVDPHGFPPLPHMLGSVQFAIERYQAEQEFRRRKAEALFDTMMNADPTVISAAGSSLQAGQEAEQRLIGLLAGIRPESHEFIKTLTPSGRGQKRLPVFVDPAMPAVIQTENTGNPFNSATNGVEYSGQERDPYANYYVAPEVAKAMIKYLPGLGLARAERGPTLKTMMSKGALLVLRGKSDSSQTQTGEVLHLLNDQADLTTFAHPRSSSANGKNYLYDIYAQSTTKEYGNAFPLFDLVKTFPPELVERIAMVDLRDITSEEQLKFYMALDSINKLCVAIEKKFDEYVAQTIGDVQMTEFLTGIVAKTLEDTFASLENERLRNELKVGYASILTRIRTQKGLIKSSPSGAMHIQTPQQPAKKGPGLWDKFRKALS